MRLTKRNADGIACSAKPFEISTFDMLDKLADYEDAEEQGRLVILPCKVGDTVFYCCRKERQVLALKCEGYLHTGVAWKVRCTDIIPSWIGNQKRHFYLMENSFGKTVFFTREEAEAALKGGRDDGTAQAQPHRPRREARRAAAEAEENEQAGNGSHGPCVYQQLDEEKNRNRPGRTGAVQIRSES